MSPNTACNCLLHINLSIVQLLCLYMHLYLFVSISCSDVLSVFSFFIHISIYLSIYLSIRSYVYFIYAKDKNYGLNFPTSVQYSFCARNLGLWLKQIILKYRSLIGKIKHWRNKVRSWLDLLLQLCCNPVLYIYICLFLSLSQWFENLLELLHSMLLSMKTYIR